MAQENVYNLNPDKNSLLIDKRKNGYNKDYFVDGASVEPVCLINKLPYVYGLTKNYQNIDFEKDDLSQMEKLSSNCAILLDDEGYPLFSKTLLTKYGIGFLLNTWLYRDWDDEHQCYRYKVGFKKHFINSSFYEWRFYKNKMPSYMEYYDDIYSFKNFYKYTYPIGKGKKYEENPNFNPDAPVIDPDQEIDDEHPIDPTKNSHYFIYQVPLKEYLIPNLMGVSEGIASETYLRQTLDSYDKIDYTKNPRTDLNTTELWQKFLLSRRYIGTRDFYKFRNNYKINEAELNFTEDKPEPKSREFLVPEIYKDENGNLKYYFYICCSEYSDWNENPNRDAKIDDVFRLAETDPDHPLVKYRNFAFWNEEEYTDPETNQKKTREVLWKYNYTAEGAYPKIGYNNRATDTTYAPGNDVNREDYDFKKPVTDSNGETNIIRELLYVQILTKIKDISPYDTIPGREPEYTFKKFWEYAFDNLIVNPYETSVYNSVKADEILEEVLSDDKIKWQTPSEYYSNNNNMSNTSNIDNPFGISNLSWFWLDSLSNWCRYEMLGGFLCLYVWNGRNGWDNFTDIINYKNTMYLDSLYRKYYYNHLFFIEGPAYPGDRWDFVPIRYNNAVIGQVYYRTFILNRDTTMLNYNDKFQNMHDTKTYQTGERNEKSNAGIGVEGLTTYAGNPIPADESRRAIHGIPTQYCPCVFKLPTGNLALAYQFYVPSNGYGVMDVENVFQIIKPDEANNRCRDIFGDGSDKTIFKDWKRYNIVNSTDEVATDIKFGSEETIYGATSITQSYGNYKINNIKFYANRPNPTTTNRDIQDYLERWDR